MLNQLNMTRLSIALTTLVVLLTSALPADATCNPVVPGRTVNAYANFSNTGNALTKTANYRLGTFPAGTTIIVGTAGLTAASATRDTFLRLNDQYGEVAYNDDACGGLGSRIVYTVPQGVRTFTLKAGCYSDTTCGGSVKIWTRLDSNGYLSEPVLWGYDHIAQNDSGRTATFTIANNAPIHDAYIDGFGFSYNHFQGIQRLYRPYDGDSWFVFSGSSTGDLMFGYPSCVGSRTIDRTWKENGLQSFSTFPNACSGGLSSTRRFQEQAPELSNQTLNHFGGIQQTGNYLVAGLQQYPIADEYNGVTAGRILLLDVSDGRASAATMKKWEINPYTYNLGNIGASNGAITKHRDGTILIAMSRADENTIDFYQKNADEYTTVLTTPLAYPLYQLGVGRAGFADIESLAGFDYVGAVRGPNNANINLFTALDGGIYLLATRKVSGSNSMVYSRIDNATKSLAPWADTERRRFPCLGTNFCYFDGAAGFYADAISDRMYLYSTTMYLNDTFPTRSMGISELGTTLAPINP